MLFWLALIMIKQAKSTHAKLKKLFKIALGWTYKTELEDGIRLKTAIKI